MHTLLMEIPLMSAQYDGERSDSKSKGRLTWTALLLLSKGQSYTCTDGRDELSVS